MGQSKLDTLVELKYVKSSDSKELRNILEYNDINSYSYILYLNEYKNEFKHFPSPWNTVIWDNTNLNSRYQDKANKELSTFIKKLFEHNLIKENQFNKQIEKINNNTYFHKIQLLEDLAAQQNYEDWINPKDVIKYGEKLFQHKIISKTSLDSLQLEIEKGDFNSHSQLYKYFKNSKYFDLSKYDNNPAIYLEGIHKEVSTILPELHFTDFKYEIVIDSNWSDKDYISRNVIVSIKANGKTYKQKSFIALDDFIQKGTYLGKIDDQEFYQIFNKILSDNQAPYRLHRFGGGLQQYGDNSSHQYFGIIVLEKSQTDMFRYSNSYIQVSYENFKNKLTSSKIDKAITQFETLGLFNHLTNEQIGQGKEEVKEQDNQNLNDVLSAFPNVIYYFDTELSNIDNPYEELVAEYAKITNGEFKPMQITDDFDIEKGKTATLNFTVNEKQFSKAFSINGDWIDYDFFEFMKTICNENNLKGQFYELYTGGQDVGIIYLNQKQYEFLRTNKLLTFGDELENEGE